MFRALIFAFLISTASAAVAEVRVGPEIAYSSGNEIYLVNSNGSDTVRIYRGKGSGFINSVALKKDGGAIAFVDNWVLKFMSYTASGLQSGPIYSLPVCYRHADVQYSPDSNFVIYHEICDGKHYVTQVAVPNSSNPSPTPQRLFENADLIDLGGFDGSGQSFVYTLTNATAWELRRYYLSGAVVPDVLVTSRPASGPQFRHPSISHDGARALVSGWYDSTGPAGTGYTSEYATSSGEVLRSNFITGQRGDYAPDDGRILFRVKDGRTSYLRYLDESGLPKQVAKSTAYLAFHDIDWGD